MLIVVFMDEAGLPEESHESLKVAILYQVVIATNLSLKYICRHFIII